MADVKGYVVWGGREHDVLSLHAEGARDWIVEPLDGDERLLVYREVDRAERPTSRVVGVEIADFLEFDRWEDLPPLEVRWQLAGRAPLPLPELLRQIQRELRESHAPAPEQAALAP